MSGSPGCEDPVEAELPDASTRRAAREKGEQKRGGRKGGERRAAVDATTLWRLSSWMHRPTGLREKRRNNASKQSTQIAFLLESAPFLNNNQRWFTPFTWLDKQEHIKSGLIRLMQAD